MSDATSADARVRWERVRDITVSRFDDEGLLVVPSRALQAVLNDTATRLLEYLEEGPSTGAELSRRLAEEFEGASADEVEADVLALLVDLEGRGAVRRADAA